MPDEPSAIEPVAGVTAPPEQTAEDLEEEPQPSRKKMRWGPWLGAVLGLLAVGVVIWLVAQTLSGSPQSAPESTLTLETFVVNLSNGSNQRAFLRVGITLGLSRPLPRNKPDAIPTALVRDTILAVLAGAQPEELLKAEGKRQLKDQLLKALQDQVPQIGVENVYFTEFLVQM